jgi:hypothetical protein
MAGSHRPGASILLGIAVCDNAVVPWGKKNLDGTETLTKESILVNDGSMVDSEATE